MAGEGEFVRGGEDPQPGVARILGRQEEHRLGQVQLPGHALHRVRGQAAAVREDRERVAFERGSGEDVRDDVPAPAGARVAGPQVRVCHAGKPNRARSVRPFHSAPAAGVVPPRGVHGHRRVQQGDQRQAGRPPRREPVQPEHGQVGQRHQRPPGQARGRGGFCCASRAGRERREAGDGAGGRQQVDEGQPGHGPGQQPGGVPELDVRGPRHHLPQVGEPRVGPHAHHLGGQPEPAASALALDDLAEGHVVDPGAADRGQPAGSRQGLAADQHAAAGRGRGAGPGRVHPRERVELGEEVHERRDHHPLPPGRGAQQRHLRDQVPVAGLGRADQVPQRALVPGDVGVGEQHVSLVSLSPAPVRA